MAVASLIGLPTMVGAALVGTKSPCLITPPNTALMDATLPSAVVVATKAALTIACELAWRCDVLSAYAIEPMRGIEQLSTTAGLPLSFAPPATKLSTATTVGAASPGA
eukprot:6635578-Prymnesium_polylepis.1